MSIYQGGVETHVLTSSKNKITVKPKNVQKNQQRPKVVDELEKSMKIFADEQDQSYFDTVVDLIPIYDSRKYSK